MSVQSWKARGAVVHTRAGGGVTHFSRKSMRLPVQTKSQPVRDQSSSRRPTERKTIRASRRPAQTQVTVSKKV